VARGRPARDVGGGTRRVALRALERIDAGGAYANLVLPAILAESDLDERDRHFVTELVYGTTRMRRACDHLVDRFVAREVEPHVRNVLRLGAYQIAFMAVPDHAAVGETVAVAPARARGFVNAVLRRVSSAPLEWPTPAHELSYPDWVVARLTADLGERDALGALRAMNEAPAVTERADGYVQDLASQWVAALVEARAGELVGDLCAAPGGKATALASAGAVVLAADVRPARAALVRANAERLGADVLTVTADARRPPLRGGALDRVLVDAPCSGLGTLRRRPDARWRIEEAAVERLAALQREIVDRAVELVRPGGVLVYSVCTLTAAETLGVDDHLATAHAALAPVEAPGEPWRPWGRGALLLPQSAGTDGMFLLRLRRPL
jgi:16S rRNA (cytosine967-C5)-methyltransferase